MIQDILTVKKKIELFCQCGSPGDDPNKYEIVQWVTGWARNPDGSPRSVQLYGEITDPNFKYDDRWIVDNTGPLPAYTTDKTSLGSGSGFSVSDTQDPRTKRISQYWERMEV